MCESRPSVEKIVYAGLFPYKMFYVGLLEKTKEEILDEFQAGNVRVIVATGAFSIGINIVDIRLIIYVNNPRNIIDYGQASRRAGRNR